MYGGENLRCDVLYNCFCSLVSVNSLDELKDVNEYKLFLKYDASEYIYILWWCNDIFILTMYASLSGLFQCICLTLDLFIPAFSLSLSVLVFVHSVFALLSDCVSSYFSITLHCRFGPSPLLILTPQPESWIQLYP